MPPRKAKVNAKESGFDWASLFGVAALAAAIGLLTHHRGELLDSKWGGKVCGLGNSSSFSVWSRRVVTYQGVVSAAVRIEDGKFASISLASSPPTGATDFGNAVISPGLVDLHVHMNEPGREHWEGFVTGTQSAAAGGITTLVDQPLNCLPAITTLAAFNAKLASSAGKLYVDVAFWGGLVPSNAGNATALKELLSAPILGLKAFMSPSGIEDFEHTSPAHLAAALPLLAASGRPLMVHAELLSELPEPAGAPEGGKPDPREYATYLATRPRAWEQAAIAAVVGLARPRGAPGAAHIHIAHVSDADSVGLVREAKAAGKALSAETCPHYLAFAAEEVPKGDTRFKCAPPIREAENRDRLWSSLLAGDLDTIGSDHSPAPPELRLFDSGDFLSAWGGIQSLQLSLPAVWTAARARGATLVQMAQWWSSAPAAVAGLSNKGRIEQGADADMVVWDPEASFVVDKDFVERRLRHRHKATPYAGKAMQGKVLATFVRGRLVYSGGEVSATPCGQPVLFTPPPKA